MGRNKKVTCKVCLRVMRSDALKRHLGVHERRGETSKPHHQFYNYNIYKNIKLYKEKTTMGKNKKEDIWACYNCNRWETDDRCHICNATTMKIHIIHTLENNDLMCRELLDEMLNKVVEPEDHPTTKRKFDGEQYTQDDQPSIKRKCGDNMIDDEVLEKMLEEQTVQYNRKVDLGEKVYKILGRGKVKQAALSRDMQNMK